MLNLLKAARWFGTDLFNFLEITGPYFLLSQGNSEHPDERVVVRVLHMWRVSVIVFLVRLFNFGRISLKHPIYFSRIFLRKILKSFSPFGLAKILYAIMERINLLNRMIIKLG